MKTNRTTSPDVAQDLLGRKLAAYLSDSSQALPHDISERLRVARLQAMARYKSTAAAEVNALGGGTAGLRLGGDSTPWWASLATLLPLLLLVAGLTLIHTFDTDIRAKELAEIDTALLADDLPPAAYTDPGFLQFLKTKPQIAPASDAQ